MNIPINNMTISWDDVRKNITHIKWDDIKNNIEEFSPIFFRDYDFVSNKISDISKANSGNGMFSHCGFAFTKKSFPNVDNLMKNTWYIFESTFSKEIKLGNINIRDPVAPDAITGEGSFGVQIRRLRDVIRTYSGDVYIGRLINNPWRWYDNVTLEEINQKRNILIGITNNFYVEFYDRLYDPSPLNLLSVTCPLFRPFRYLDKKLLKFIDNILNTNLSNAAICSYLLGKFYQDIGLIDKNFKLESLFPTDFVGTDVEGLENMVSQLWLVTFQ